MAKPSSRVVLNRGAIHKMLLAVADGASEVARTVVDVAEPPDATPIGTGLVTSGGYLTYVNGQKVDGWGQDGKQPKPPRAARVSKGVGVVAVVGFGFPGRFQEFGTIHHPAQPFLTPARDRVKPQVPSIMAPIVRSRMPR
jgi:HK97 gp10 family phage protein